jgi:hypothetical protein
MNHHLMLDFETLNDRPDSAVLSLGAVILTAEKGIVAEKEWIFSLDEQFKARSSVSAATLLWWLEKEKAAQDIFKKTQTHGISMRIFLMEFSEWLRPYDVRVWGNGASFDVPIIENILHRGNQKIPWKFWNVRCYRTLKILYGIEKGIERRGTHHNALDDARYQATCLYNFLKQNPNQNR